MRPNNTTENEKVTRDKSMNDPEEFMLNEATVMFLMSNCDIKKYKMENIFNSISLNRAGEMDTASIRDT